MAAAAASEIDEDRGEGVCRRCRGEEDSAGMVASGKVAGACKGGDVDIEERERGRELRSGMIEVKVEDRE